VGGRGSGMGLSSSCKKNPSMLAECVRDTGHAVDWGGTHILNPFSQGCFRVIQKDQCPLKRELGPFSYTILSLEPLTMSLYLKFMTTIVLFHVQETFYNLWTNNVSTKVQTLGTVSLHATTTCTDGANIA